MLDGIKTTDANRGNLAVLLYNTLDIPTWDVGSTTINGELNFVDGKTLREIYFSESLTKYLVNASANNAIINGTGEYLPGKTVTVEVDIPSDSKFYGFKSLSGLEKSKVSVVESSNKVKLEFTMPNNDVYIEFNIQREKVEDNRIIPLPYRDEEIIKIEFNWLTQDGKTTRYSFDINQLRDFGVIRGNCLYMKDFSSLPEFEDVVEFMQVRVHKRVEVINSFGEVSYRTKVDSY